MNQTYYILKEFLHILGVEIPNVVIKRMLDSPVGNTMRGISDALDLLNIENEVYQLPVEYLKELEYPYLMVLPHRKNVFTLIANAKEKEKALPEWKGVVLTAKKTENTPIYKYVWPRNMVDAVRSNWLQSVFAVLAVAFIMIRQPTLGGACHTLLSLLGVWLSLYLLKKEYAREYVGDKYCKLGQLIDCEKVLNSKGSHLFGIFRLSDMAFLFFLTQVFLVLLPTPNWYGTAQCLLIVGCCFTVYSLVYQFAVVHKTCLFCLSITFIVWLDGILLVYNTQYPTVFALYPFIFSGLISYIIWRGVTYNAILHMQANSLKERQSMLYGRELFECLLSQEREVEDIDDKYADMCGKAGSDVLTLFIHPKCKKCKKAFDEVQHLTGKAKVKIVSLETVDSGLLEYCKRNKISQTPTILFNGRKLPELYGVEDLKYII